MSLSNRINKLLTASVEDLGPTDEDKLSESQIEEIEDRKELEDRVKEQQDALDAVTKDLATRDDGDGAIGEIRDAIVDISESKSEIESIRKQLEVATNNAVAAPDKQLKLVKKDEDEEDHDNDEGDEDPMDDSGDDDIDEEVDGDADDEDDSEDEVAAVESIRLQVNRLYSRLGVSASIESYSGSMSPAMARDQLLDVVTSLESNLDSIRPSLEWFNINALRTTITSIFSVTKALQINKKRIEANVRKHGAKAVYESVSLPEWALELITVDGKPLTNLKESVDRFAAIVRHLVDNTVVKRADVIAGIVNQLQDLDSLTEKQIEDILKEVNDLAASRTFSADMMIRGKGPSHTVLNSTVLSPIIDPKSGFSAIGAGRNQNNTWFKSAGLKGVYLTATAQDDLPGLHTLVLPVQDIVDSFNVLLDLLDEIKRFSDKMEDSHKSIKGITGLIRNVEALHPSLVKSIHQLESTALGLYASTDTLSTTLKQVMYRCTALSSHIAYN